MSSPPTLELPFPATPAIDEMNLVEIPFALMTRSTTQRVLTLSPDGKDRLVADESVGGLPTALGERVLVALLYFHKCTDGFRTPKIRLPLRAFLKDYLFPQRNYRPSATTVEAVQEQLRRIAHTRIVSSRWYDKTLSRHVEIDASIIDYIKIVEAGGNNRAKLLEIRWGELFFNSLRARYTKPLNYALWMGLKRPLTRRLYRWLDRQLHSKRTETVRAWQFGRFKLGLTHQRLAAPGRRASKYLVSELEPCIEELASADYFVVLEVDSSADDFSLTFSRAAVPQRKASIVRPAAESDTPLVEDPISMLLDYFNLKAHKVKSTRVHEGPDRELAAAWLQSYGQEEAHGLIDSALTLIRIRKEPLPYKFRRLSFYEDAARGHNERVSREQQGQLPLPEPALSQPVENIPVPEELQELNERFLSALPQKIAIVLRSAGYVALAGDFLELQGPDRTTLTFLLKTNKDALCVATHTASQAQDIRLAPAEK